MLVAGTGRHGFGVLVLVMFVVCVPVVVHDGFVGVFVAVVFGQVQPHTECHEETCDDELPGEGFAEQDRQERTEERGDGEVCTGAGGADVAHADDEQGEADPVREEPDDQSCSDAARRGRVAPSANARIRLTGPAARPFTAASQVASLRAILRVRLLSRPQKRQAPRTAIAGHGLPSSAPFGMLSRTAPATIAIMPSAMRRSKFSRNTNQASSAVKTPSAFNRRDAPEAGMLESPTINRTGAIMPPLRIAPASGSSSLPLEPDAGCTADQAQDAQPDPGAAVKQASQQPRAGRPRRAEAWPAAFPPRTAAQPAAPPARHGWRELTGAWIKCRTRRTPTLRAAPRTGTSSSPLRWDAKADQRIVRSATMSTIASTRSGCRTWI